jgi:hypothetical protein
MMMVMMTGEMIMKDLYETKSSLVKSKIGCDDDDDDADGDDDDGGDDDIVVMMMYVMMMVMTNMKSKRTAGPQRNKSNLQRHIILLQLLSRIDIDTLLILVVFDKAVPF